jgi:hypothetical protein
MISIGNDTAQRMYDLQSTSGHRKSNRYTLDLLDPLVEKTDEKHPLFYPTSGRNLAARFAFQVDTEKGSDGWR